MSSPGATRGVPAYREASFRDVFGSNGCGRTVSCSSSITRNICRDRTGTVSTLRGSVLDVIGERGPFSMFVYCGRASRLNGEAMSDILTRSVCSRLASENFGIFFTHVALRSGLNRRCRPCVFTTLGSTGMVLTVKAGDRCCGTI